MFTLNELEYIRNKNCNKNYMLVTIDASTIVSDLSKTRDGISFDCVENLDQYKNFILPSVFNTKKYNIYVIKTSAVNEILVTTRTELNIEKLKNLIDLINYHIYIREDNIKFEDITELYKIQSNNRKYPNLEKLKKDNNLYEREKLYKEIKNKEKEIKNDKRTLEQDEEELKKLLSRLTNEERLKYEIGEL